MIPKKIIIQESEKIKILNLPREFEKAYFLIIYFESGAMFEFKLIVIRSRCIKRLYEMICFILLIRDMALDKNVYL